MAFYQMVRVNRYRPACLIQDQPRALFTIVNGGRLVMKSGELQTIRTIGTL